MCERWGRYWRSNEGGTSLPRSVANIRCNEHRIPTLLCHDNGKLREFENEYLSMETEPDASLIASIIDPEIVSEIAELQLDTHGEFAIEEHRADRCMELALCAYNHSLLLAALRAGADPNSELSGQWGIVPTPLGFAINEQPPNFAAIRTLLAHKADIECRVLGDEDATGTYLHFAIFGSRNFWVSKFLGCAEFGNHPEIWAVIATILRPLSDPYVAHWGSCGFIPTGIHHFMIGESLEGMLPTVILET